MVCNVIRHYSPGMYQRQLVQIRLSTEGVKNLDGFAHGQKVTRSDVIRACLKIALSQPEKVVAELDRQKAAL